MLKKREETRQVLERLRSPGPPRALRASCVSRWLF